MTSPLVARVAVAAFLIACSSSPSTSDAGHAAPDSGTVVDASTFDAHVIDAATLPDANTSDANTSDAGSCRAERITFPASGGLMPGQLCDDVFVCAPDAEYAARLVAASPAFNCTAVDGYPCDGVLCRYEDNGGAGPSTLDELEIAGICAATLLDPPPLAFRCMIYL
jgi:hypothetical protein